MTSVNNNNNEQKIQEILSRFRQGNKENVDSIVEYTELSIFLKENSDTLTNAQKQRLHEQLKNYNARNITSGSRYDKNSNSNIDKSTMYASKTYQLAGTNYLISVDVHPNIDGSGVTKLVDIYNPKTNERTSIEDLVYRFDVGEGVAEEELSDFQKICRSIKNNYGCDFREYMSFYHFNGKDLSFNPPRKTNSAGNTEISSQGVVGTSSTSGSYDIKGEKIGDIKPIEENDSNKKYAQAFNLILQRFNDAVSMFKGQQAENSVYTKFAEAFHFWGPTPSDAIKAIKNMENDITTLRMDLELNDFSKFESDFSEIFGKSFDNESIQTYNEDCALYQLVSQKQTVIEAFKQWNKDYFDKTYNTDITDETVDKLYNELLKLSGGNENELQRLIGQAETKWRENNKDNPTLPSMMDYGWYNIKDNTRKSAYLKIVIQDMIANLEKDLLDTTGGKSFKQVKQAHQALYEKAFGTKNDAFKTVESCCEYQQVGTQITKGVVMAGVLLTVGVSSGGLAILTVPAATFGADFANSAIDEATKNKALSILNTKGASAYLDHMMKDVHWGEICSESAKNAAISVIFMGQAYTISNVCRIAGTAAGMGEKAILGMTMGTQMAGDAALGSAIEYAATGEITIDGVVFTIVMDIVGNAVHIKDYHKKNGSSGLNARNEDIGFNNKSKAPKLSENSRAIEAELNASGSSSHVQNIKQSIQKNKNLSPTEKEYLLRKCETRGAEVRQSEIMLDEFNQEVQNVTNPDELDVLALKINDMQISGKQKQQLRSIVEEKIYDFVQEGKIEPTEIDLHMMFLTDAARAGSGVPKILSDSFSSESISKMSRYLVDKAQVAHPDTYFEAIGKITERILGGEVPSKVMFDEVTEFIQKAEGAPNKKDISKVLLSALNKIDELKEFVNGNFFGSKAVSNDHPSYRKKFDNFKKAVEKNQTNPNKTPQVEVKAENTAAPKQNTQNIFSEDELKIIKRYATDTNPKVLQNVINDIVDIMKNGNIPDLEFIESLAQKYNVRPEGLKNDLSYCLRKFGNINENYASLRTACLTSNKNTLAPEIVEGLNKLMQSKNIAFNENVKEISSAKPEAEVKPTVPDIRESAEYKKYAEKYPELSEIPFRDDKNLIEAGKAFEKYETEMNGQEFNETDLYQRLSDIKNDADIENAAQLMKNKYHSDVVAEENRVANLKTKFGVNEEEIQVSDRMIEQIKEKQANDEPFLIDDLNVMIEEVFGYNDVINSRIRNRILAEIKI